MEFCDRHLAALDAALRVRGLDKVHCKTQRQKERLVAIMNMEASAESLQQPDASLLAQWIICTLALENGGDYMLETDDCPLCEVDAVDSAATADWITRASDNLLHVFSADGYVTMGAMQ